MGVSVVYQAYNQILVDPKNDKRFSTFLSLFPPFNLLLHACFMAVQTQLTVQRLKTAPPSGHPLWN